MYKLILCFCFCFCMQWSACCDVIYKIPPMHIKHLHYVDDDNNVDGDWWRTVEVGFSTTILLLPTD